MTTTLAPTTVHDTRTATAGPDTRAAVTIPQYSRKAIFAIWAAAASPMGIGAWIVARAWPTRSADRSRCSRP